MELASCHSSGAWNLEVASRFLDNFCTLDLAVYGRVALRNARCSA